MQMSGNRKPSAWNIAAWFRARMAAQNRLPIESLLDNRRWLCRRRWRWIIDWWHDADCFVRGGAVQSLRWLVQKWCLDDEQ